MSGPASSTQWYLARDGQQFGPISDAELAKFIELGHMQPNDLLWREGFPDWRPAMVVFPPRPQPAPVTTPPQGHQHSGPRIAPAATRVPLEDDSQPGLGAGRGRRWTRVAMVLVVLAAAGAIVWFAYPYRHLIGSMTTLATSDAYAIADRKSLEVPPFKGFSGSTEATDAKLQETALWRVIKREFPDWYAKRLTEAAEMVRSGKDEAAIGEVIGRRLVDLRRQQVTNALSATLPRLKALATTFYDNLATLRRYSTDACYGFILQGEANPEIVKILQGSPHTALVQAQLTGVFEAIAEGRKQPRVYPQPRQADYDKLAADLKKRGWTQADMQLFANDRALVHATPEKVCQMVHDWFASQLSFTDAEGQMRLLVESLRPVVAG